MTDQDITRSTGPRGLDGEPAPVGALISERWELVEHIGEGGMSDVYKARHVIMQKFGAVKFLKGGLAEDPVAVKRFQQEALASGTLSHANIVQVYDCGLSQYGVYLIMELLDGISLSDVMDARREDSPDGRGVLQIEEALPIFLQICDGLEHAHKKGIVHRDIKPSNVMLVEPESPKTDNPDEVQVKLVDFGIAKMVGLDGTSSEGNLTRTGEVFGSPFYMSPEQCLGKPLDGRADIYSLGCLIYEALTGRKVLAGPNSTETMLRHVEEEADLSGLLEIKHALAKPLAAVLEHCLSRHPSDRYNDVAELRAALLDLDKNNIYHTRSSVEPKRDIRAIVFVFTAFAAVVAASASVAALLLWPPPPASGGEGVPIAMPVKTPERQKADPGMMSSRLFSGGEGVVSRLIIDPERQQKYCLKENKRGDDNLAVRSYDAATRSFDVVANMVQDRKGQIPGSHDLLLHAMVGKAIAQSEMKDLDGLDILLGEMIKASPEYYNASNKEKRFALQWRATVQRNNGSYAAAAATIEQMLVLDQENSAALSDNDLQHNEEITQKALWTGLLADLLRITDSKESQNPVILTDYARSLATLESTHSPDAAFAEELGTFKGRLYYRYGLALDQARKYPEAYKAFQSSLAVFAAQGGLGARLRPEVAAAKVHSFLALKQYDWLESIKYRLQNHV